MDEATLSRRLSALAPPNLDSARERAKLAARVSTGMSPAAPYPRWWAVSVRARTSLVAAGICIALVATCLFTSPGQAIATWIGERIGFGEPGGPPTLRQLRASWTKETMAEGQPAYVLLHGPVPGGGRYEFITYRSKREPGQHWPAGGRCFELDLTQLRSSYNAGCGALPADKDLLIVGAAGGGMPGDELHFFSGRTSDRVESVEIEFGGRRVPVELVPVSPELIERFGIARPFKFFIAFLPDIRRGGRIEVTARDATGNSLARKERELPDLEAGFAKLCKKIQRRDPGAKHPSPLCESG